MRLNPLKKQKLPIKGLFQSDRLKKHMVTIVIDQLLSNCEKYEHRFLENINKLYTSSGKCDDQIQFKAII